MQRPGDLKVKKYASVGSLLTRDVTDRIDRLHHAYRSGAAMGTESPPYGWYDLVV
jgi:hypothetical protein